MKKASYNQGCLSQKVIVRRFQETNEKFRFSSLLSFSSIQNLTLKIQNYHSQPNQLLACEIYDSNSEKYFTGPFNLINQSTLLLFIFVLYPFTFLFSFIHYSSFDPQIQSVTIVPDHLICGLVVCVIPNIYVAGHINT